MFNIKRLFNHKKHSSENTEKDIIISNIHKLHKHINISKRVVGNITTYTYRSVATQHTIEVCINLTRHIFSIKENDMLLIEEDNLTVFLSRLSKVAY